MAASGDRRDLLDRYPEQQLDRAPVSGAARVRLCRSAPERATAVAQPEELTRVLHVVQNPLGRERVEGLCHPLRQRLPVHCCTVFIGDGMRHLVEQLVHEVGTAPAFDLRRAQ